MKSNIVPWSLCAVCTAIAFAFPVTGARAQTTLGSVDAQALLQQLGQVRLLRLREVRRRGAAVLAVQPLEGAVLPQNIASAAEDQDELRTMLPENDREGFDVRPVVEALADEDSVTAWIPPEELGAINPKAKLAHVLAMVSAESPNLNYPNREFKYDTVGSEAINRLSDVVNTVVAQDTTRLGSNIGAFWRRHLAQPLGFRLPRWPRDPQGIYFGGNEMSMTPRQMVT